jgi:hypothetical protein
VEYYSAIKKNEIILFAGKWTELENIMLGEVSQACVCVCVCVVRENKILLVDLSEKTTGGRRGKDNVRE